MYPLVQVLLFGSILRPINLYKFQQTGVAPRYFLFSTKLSTLSCRKPRFHVFLYMMSQQKKRQLCHVLIMTTRFILSNSQIYVLYASNRQKKSNYNTLTCPSFLKNGSAIDVPDEGLASTDGLLILLLWIDNHPTPSIFTIRYKDSKQKHVQQIRTQQS